MLGRNLLASAALGLYWGLRSFAVCIAPLAGAAVWYGFGPEALLLLAFALGGVGAGVFCLFRRPPALPPGPAGLSAEAAS
ncbi:MAG TPA: hypothetical protein VFA26_07515 [Gemmataceae bacterium]|nr:hypothetical protein [Gemmataceae bacterium]